MTDDYEWFLEDSDPEEYARCRAKLRADRKSKLQAERIVLMRRSFFAAVESPTDKGRLREIDAALLEMELSNVED